MKNKLFIPFLLFATFAVQAQFLQIDFENESGYTTSIPEFSDGNSDFFTRTNGENIGSYTLTNHEGAFYFAAQDIDGEGATLPVSLSIPDIDINGHSNIQLKVLLAEDDDGSNQDWDEADYFHIDYQLDKNGTWHSLLHLESEGSSNTPPRIDTNFDGTGNGQEITDTFQEFSASIGETGSLLDIRITFNLNSGDEDIAMDLLQLFSDTDEPIIETSRLRLKELLKIENEITQVIDSFELTGSALLDSVLISPGAFLEVGLDRIQMTDSILKIPNTDGVISATRIYCRYKTDTPAGEYQGNISISSTGADAKTIIYNATVYPAAFSSIVINEVDADTYGSDVDEFIELYDGGAGNTPLKGLCLVLFNGYNAAAYGAFDLASYSTTPEGFFVMGSAQVPGVNYPAFTTNGLQNGCDAIALYLDSAKNFSNGSTLTNKNLLDALVYHTDDERIEALMVLLDSAQSEVNENQFSGSDYLSVQRVANGSGGQRKTTSFCAAAPTPGTQNFDAVWKGESGNSWTDTSNWSFHVPESMHKVYIPASCSFSPSVEPGVHLKALVLENDACLLSQENLTLENDLCILHHLSASENENNLNHWQFFAPPFSNAVVGDLLSNNDKIDLWLSAYDNTISTSLDNSWFYPGKDEAFTLGKAYALTYVYDQEEPGATINGSDCFMEIQGDLPDLSNNPMIELSYNGPDQNNWNLIGNPYLCGFNWFNADLILDNIAGNTAYLYHPENGSYSTYQSFLDGTGLSSPSGSGIIPAMQGFFVKASAGGFFELAKIARSQEHEAFLKSETLASYLNLRVSVDSVFDQTSIIFNNAASIEYDNWDAEKIIPGSTTLPQIYSLTPDNTKLVFNHSNLVDTLFSLQIKTSKAGDYEIMVAEANGIFREYECILINGRNESYRIDNNIYQFTGTDDIELHTFAFKLIGPETSSLVLTPPGTGIYYAHQMLHIPVSSRKRQLTIYNTSGKIVAKSTIARGESTYKCDNIRGIHIVQLISDEMHITEKIHFY